MRDDQSDAVDDPPIAPAHCVACDDPISPRARRCKVCGSPQNWTRHFTFGHTILSLLVALVSVTGISAPTIMRTLQGSNSAIDVVWAGSAGDDVTFVVTNRGTRSGVLNMITLSIVNPKRGTEKFPKDFLVSRVIQAGELGSITLTFKGWNREFEQFSHARARGMYFVTDFSGKKSERTFYFDT